MNMVRWYIKQNQRLIAEGKPPLVGMRYKEKHKAGHNRHATRKDAAILRFKGDTAHECGKTRARNWHQDKRRKRKAQRVARRRNR